VRLAGVPKAAQIARYSSDDRPLVVSILTRRANLRCAAKFMWLAALLANASILLSRPAEANQAFSQQTGKGCPFCHTAPPALNSNGKKFKANGNKL
jgi:hypothetical protein